MSVVTKSGWVLEMQKSQTKTYSDNIFSAFMYLCYGVVFTFFNWHWVRGKRFLDVFYKNVEAFLVNIKLVRSLWDIFLKNINLS